MILKNVISLVMGLLLCSVLNAQTLAFPGAEGGGMYTSGGRGGKILYVTSLEDTNTQGTLRWAIGQTGKRTILFKVSGIIELKSQLNISNGDLTIAGQTAPGDGICIKGYPVQIRANNVIIRFLRFRMGDETKTESDALWGRNQKNIIIDHCSMSWSTDECASFYSNENFTLQWSIISESLTISVHSKGSHGYGGIWGGMNASFHHNLLAHHNSRNPRFNGWKRSGLSYSSTIAEERLDYRNNVLYNWGDNSAYGGEGAGKYNMVGNYYKPGPATKSSVRTKIVQVDMDGDPSKCPPGYGQFYIDGNYMHGSTTVTNSNWNGVTYKSGVDRVACKALQPFDYLPISEHTAEKAFEKVLAYAGASLVRDAVDARIADEVRNGTTTYVGSEGGRKGLIDSQKDVGGWPAYNSTSAPVDSDSDGIPDGWLDEHASGKKSTDLNEDGYTYLEVYINSLVHDLVVNQNEGSGISSSIESPLVESDLQIEGGILYTDAREIMIYDLSGKLIRVAKNVSQMDLNHLERGTYLIYILKNDASQSVHKFLK